MPERNGGAAARVGIYAALAFDIFSATNSSPQTTEINAVKRAPTLMKWVNIGAVQVAAFAILGAILDPDTWPPLVGAGLGGGAMYAQYVYAKRCGLTDGGESTEDYGAPAVEAPAWLMGR